MKSDRFKEKLEQNKKQQAILKTKLDQLGTLRVITFIAGAIVIVGSNYIQYTIGYFIGLFLCILFGILVRQYGKVNANRNYCQAEKKVLEAYIARLGEEWKSFRENGEHYVGELSKVKDLDLLGRASLYQYICSAHTSFGKKALERELVIGHKEKQILLNRQEAVKELIEDEAFAIHLQTISMQMSSKNQEGESESIEQFIEEAEKQESYTSKLMKGLAMLLPLITLFALVIIVLGFGTPTIKIVAEVGVGVQILITLWQFGKTSALFAPIFDFNENVSVYKDFLVALEDKKFTSSYLKGLQEKLLINGGAVKGIEDLNQLTSNVKLRHNMIANFLLNGLFMWDIHCKDALGIWNRKYGRDMRIWLEVIGEVEALLSLAVIGRVKQNYCFPNIIESQVPQLQFTNLMHPMIIEEKAVGNSSQIMGETCIITGSNMSGKTTFLRSIGVNLALAYAGGPVVAESFETSYMEVFTSMRIEDRVDEGISTFYAELLRIKEMIEYSQRHLPMLTLIDEIFKGTNSADRILGATETIKKLGKPWLNVMVTTHDFELCSLAEESKRKTVNYHFEEYYEENQIRFDYKLKKDRCKTTNAKYLLRMVGILE